MVLLLGFPWMISGFGLCFDGVMHPPMERLPELLSYLGELGLTCIVKVDGERQLAGLGPWTVVISGSAFGGVLVRREGRDLSTCLGDALADLETRLSGASAAALPGWVRPSTGTG